MFKSASCWINSKEKEVRTYCRVDCLRNWFIMKICSCGSKIENGIIHTRTQHNGNCFSDIFRIFPIDRSFSRTHTHTTFSIDSTLFSFPFYFSPENFKYSGQRCNSIHLNKYKIALDALHLMHSILDIFKIGFYAFFCLCVWVREWVCVCAHIGKIDTKSEENWERNGKKKDHCALQQNTRTHKHV